MLHIRRRADGLGKRGVGESGQFQVVLVAVVFGQEDPAQAGIPEQQRGEPQDLEVSVAPPLRHFVGGAVHLRYQALLVRIVAAGVLVLCLPFDPQLIPRRQ